MALIGNLGSKSKGAYALIVADGIAGSTADILDANPMTGTVANVVGADVQFSALQLAALSASLKGLLAAGGGDTLAVLSLLVGAVPLTNGVSIAFALGAGTVDNPARLQLTLDPLVATKYGIYVPNAAASGIVVVGSGNGSGGGPTGPAGGVLGYPGSTYPDPNGLAAIAGVIPIKSAGNGLVVEFTVDAEAVDGCNLGFNAGDGGTGTGGGIGFFAGDGAIGGDAGLAAGQGSTGKGGVLVLAGGTGATDGGDAGIVGGSGTTGIGGAANLIGGLTTGTTGGIASVIGGAATGGGVGGLARVFGGDALLGNAGNAIVSGGGSAGAGNGGNAIISGGEAAGAGTGGSASIDAGQSTGGGINGDVSIGESLARRVFLGSNTNTLITKRAFTKRYEVQNLLVAGSILSADYDFNTIGSAGAIALDATTPIAAVPQNLLDYGGAVTREVTFFNLNAANNITVPAAGNVLTPGGVNLVVAPRSSFTVLWVQSLGKWVVTNVGAAVA